MEFDHRTRLVRTCSTESVDRALGPGKRTLAEQVEHPGATTGSAPEIAATSVVGRGALPAAATHRPPVPLQMLFGVRRAPAGEPPLTQAAAHSTDPPRAAAAGGAVQRKASTAPAVEHEPPRPSGGGTAMPAEVQAKMGKAFGADFSAVRVHTGQHVEALGALAYTQGSDIHFAQGQYDPHSPQGQELLGHELTHVVQQAEGRVQATTQAKGVAINDDAALERQADDMGIRAARGESVVSPSLSGDSRGPATPRGGQSIQAKSSGSGAEAAATALIVDDSASALSSGQMRRTEVLDRLYQAIHRVGTEAYQGSDLTVDGCPYIAHWFERYRGKDGNSLERTLRKYASASLVASVQDLVEAVCDRARRGFQKQVTTREVTELPEDVPAEIGRGVVPEPRQPAQRKPAAERATASAVVQRGCLRAGGGGGHAAPAPVQLPVPMSGFVTVNDGHTTLTTSGFAGCIGIILIGPGTTRSLAHIYSGDITAPQNWGQLGAFMAAAANAVTTHIYHAPSYWYQGDGDSGDQFIANYGLVGNIVFHGAPAIVSVDPAMTVTP